MNGNEGYAVRRALGLGPEADGADVLAEIGWLQQSVEIAEGALRGMQRHAERAS